MKKINIQLTLPPLEEDEQDVSHDVETLFTNMLVKETIDFIVDQTYVKKKLTPIYTKLKCKRWLLKLDNECKFAFSVSFYQQSNGCTMSGPLFVTEWHVRIS